MSLNLDRAIARELIRLLPVLAAVPLSLPLVPPGANEPPPRRYTPDGRPDRTVDVPARQTTACCFGGADLSDLYVTTAREGFTEAATFIYDPNTWVRTEVGVNHGLRSANTNFLDYPNTNAFNYGGVGR